MVVLPAKGSWNTVSPKPTTNSRSSSEVFVCCSSRGEVELLQVHYSCVRYVWDQSYFLHGVFFFFSFRVFVLLSDTSLSQGRCLFCSRRSGVDIGSRGVCKVSLGPKFLPSLCFLRLLCLFRCVFFARSVVSFRVFERPTTRVHLARVLACCCSSRGEVELQ